jgi:trehalose synthase
MTLLDRYEEVVGHQAVLHLRQLAERLQGKRVVHVNSTRTGGGVAEILGWMIPLLNELGLNARWEVISGPPEFSRITKAFHNGIQGMPVSVSKQDFDLHRDVCRDNARRLNLDADVVFVHDPQPIYLPMYAPANDARWVWRCHIDASHPDEAIWHHLEGALPKYDATVFSMAAFARHLAKPAFLIAPSIDPLSEKNRPLTEAERLETLDRLGIDRDRPLLLQVSRFDRFKDPLGVIEAFRLVQPYLPAAQLVLAGGSADDDPEGPEVYAKVQEAAGNDPDIKVLMLPSDAPRDINALQRSATIVLQKSIREGFGLTVTEALWKGVPVIGGATGGITLQVHDYQTGFLVYSPAGAAYRIRYLMRYADKRERMGRVGHAFVHEHFLLIRQLREDLQMLLCLDRPGSETLVV